MHFHVRFVREDGGLHYDILHNLANNHMVQIGMW